MGFRNSSDLGDSDVDNLGLLPIANLEVYSYEMPQLAFPNTFERRQFLSRCEGDRICSPTRIEVVDVAKEELSMKIFGHSAAFSPKLLRKRCIRNQKCLS